MLKTKKITQIIKKEFKVKNFNCFLSISDEKEYSTAFAIMKNHEVRQRFFFRKYKNSFLCVSNSRSY